MKKMLLLTFFVAAISQVSVAQDEGFAYGVRWGIGVYKPGSVFEGYPGKAVAATIMYKDSSGTVMYTETHTGTLDDFSYLRFTIGQGLVPQPPGRLKPSDYEKVRKLCWSALVDSMLIEGMSDITSVPRANYAYHAKNAENAERFVNHSWNSEHVTLNEFIDRPAESEYGVVSWNSPTVNEHEFQPVDTRGFFNHDIATSVVSGQQHNVLRFGGENHRRYVVGPSTPPEIENFITYCAPSLEDAFHFLGIKIAEHRGVINHNTAAIHLDNTASERSAGLLADAQTWGVYGTGQNGVVGVTNGLGNGASITGFVGQAPDTGGFKYGLYGNANSIINAWAAALFGNSFYTGTLTMSSDARLKTQIRGQPSVLDKVMQLKPSQYNYRQDTPYGLPDGLHHGFLAQDVELIFPELVSDITMPLSLDPQEIYKSGVTDYKGINYIEMISILTSALQEMNAKIDTQAKEIAELQKALQNVNGQK